MEKNNKIETLVLCEADLIDMTKELNITSKQIETECSKSKPDKNALRALLKSLRKFSEGYLIDKDDKSQPNETKEKVSKPGLVVSIKLEGANEVTQQLKDIETQLEKIYAIPLIDKKLVLDMLSKDLIFKVENATINVSEGKDANKLAEAVEKQICTKMRSHAIRMNGNL